PGHTTQRGEERLPAAPLRVECLLPLRCETVEAAPADAGALDPPALNQAAALQAVEHGVERRHVELQRPVGAAVDQFGDFVAVAVALFEQREDEGLSAALAQLAIVRHTPAAYV